MSSRRPICPEGCEVYLKKTNTDLFCPRCGLVVDDSPIDFGPEFCVGDDMEKADRLRRTGPPKSWLNPDIGTTFYPKRT